MEAKRVLLPLPRAGEGVRARASPVALGLLLSTLAGASLAAADCGAAALKGRPRVLAEAVG